MSAEHLELASMPDLYEIQYFNKALIAMETILYFVKKKARVIVVILFKK